MPVMQKMTPSPLAPRLGALAAGTLILTPNGPVFIEDLRAGDLVLTRDAGSQPLRHVICTVPDAIHSIAPESMGHGMPWRHLRVAFDNHQPNARIPNTAQACHYRLQCKAQQVIWAEGAPVTLALARKLPETRCNPAHAPGLVTA